MKILNRYARKALKNCQFLRSELNAKSARWNWALLCCPNQTHPPFLVKRRFSKADPIATGTHLGLPAIGVSAMDRREFLGSSLGATEIGRASCRDRVCQYV